ncbi:alpha/beta hydrolase [Arenicella xantha]|uniref:Alpha/beta superfamily hydrolase n=1 Tax=Arenicella xantha TaxID=644221 RepID=A0A395JQB2_9GAMM|nr:alpha/beta hydrolase-fold protein [Arenicella xantha]RBP51768.1 hypothetical protein DFR28_1021201 [Arenicella xantha]
MTTTNKILLSLFLLFLVDGGRSHASDTISIDVAPDVATIVLGEQLRLDSSTLSEARKLNIYLPVSYESAADKKYPVIYLLDGGADEDFIHIAGLVQFTSLPWLNFTPESIVVGIENVDRKRDFTSPSSDKRDQQEFPMAGGSRAFIDFLENEVQPLVMSRYRTTGQRTLIGQSLGGLLATEVLFTKPQLFDNYLIVSPSLWWDQERLLNEEIKVIAKAQPKVFVAVGDEGSTMVRLATSLADKLNHAYQSKDFSSYAYFDELNHGDTLHLAAYHGLKSLFANGE